MSKSSYQTTRWKIWLGRFIQVGSVIFILLSLIGVGSGPFLVAKAKRLSEELLINLSQEITTASTIFRQIRESLDEADQALYAATLSLSLLTETIDEADPVLESTADLLLETAPEVIIDTQEALKTAEEGAQAVDQVLRVLAKISFITGVNYDPAQPLDEGIAQAEKGLAPLPDALAAVGTDLSNISEELADLNRSISGLERSLEDISRQLEQQQEDLVSLAIKLDRVVEVLEQRQSWIQQAGVVILVIWELTFLGMILTQTAVFFIGSWIQEVPRVIDGSS